MNLGSGQFKALDPINRKRIEKLNLVVADLKLGKMHSITRLTSIKSLCKETVVAVAFTKYLAAIAAETISTRGKPRHLTKAQWENFLCLANEGMSALNSKKSNDQKRRVLTDLRNSQNVITRLGWNNVRIIECVELAQIECALECCLGARDTERMAYESARRHAERYESRYGTGLLPSSAKPLQEIIAFWEDSA